MQIVIFDHVFSGFYNSLHHHDIWISVVSSF